MQESPSPQLDMDREEALLRGGGAAHGSGAADGGDLKRQLELKIEELTEAYRRQDEFLAALAHELRNPLAPICNGLELMRQAADDQQLSAEVRATLTRQIDQLVRLVNDLLDVSRLSLDKLPLHREPADLRDVLAAALEAVRPELEAARHRLRLTLPSAPVPALLDRARIVQALYHLLVNAIRFTPRPGTIAVRLRRCDDACVIEVGDTGIGIPPPQLDRVFDPFYRVDSSLLDLRSGLGVGLTLVRRLVTLHGGEVTAFSEGEGRGSSFIVRLPGATGVHAEGPPAVAPSAAPRQRRVLVVDDNVDAARTLARLLEIQGHAVRQAYDGEQALEVASDWQPDLVLMDLGMPRLDGFAAARAMRRQPWGRSATLVAVTGWGEDEDRRRAREAGFDHHKVKPVNLADLQALIAQPA